MIGVLVARFPCSPGALFVNARSPCSSSAAAMTTKSRISLATALLALLAWQLTAQAAGSAALVLVGTIRMAGVEGRIDHMAATPDGRRLFVAALGSDRVLLIDTQAAQVTGVITGVKEPQGVCYLP